MKVTKKVIDTLSPKLRISQSRLLQSKTYPANIMSDNESQDSELKSNDLGTKIATITELQEKIKLLRRGLFVGVLALIALGAWVIYNNVIQTAKPGITLAKDIGSTIQEAKPKLDSAMSIYNRNEKNIMSLVEQVGEIQTDIQTTVGTVDKWKELGKGFDADTRSKLTKGIQDLITVYTEMQPDIETAFKTLDGLTGNDEEFAVKARVDFETEYEKTVKPAAEDLAKKILVDIQGEAGEKFSELSTHADEIMAGATGELHALTNSIPEKLRSALDQTLVKTINDRDDKLRKMFPKLTKEKQAALVSRLSQLSKQQGEKIFLNLFADHVSELGKASDALLEIQKTETDVNTAGGKLGDIQTSLTLLSAIIEIAKGDFSTQADKKAPANKPKKEIKSEEKQTTAKEANNEQTVENK